MNLLLAFLVGEPGGTGSPTSQKAGEAVPAPIPNPGHAWDGDRRGCDSGRTSTASGVKREVVRLVPFPAPFPSTSAPRSKSMAHRAAPVAAAATGRAGTMRRLLRRTAAQRCDAAGNTGRGGFVQSCSFRQQGKSKPSVLAGEGGRWVRQQGREFHGERGTEHVAWHCTALPNVR